jgi:hypothetical protein
VAMVVLVAAYFRETRYRKLWMALTFAPLLATAVRALPMDWFSSYKRSMGPPQRRYVTTTIKAAAMPARVEYRLRALASEPLFGATEGLRYVLDPSPEGMHALRSRMVLERFTLGPVDVRRKYLRIAVELPYAFFPAGVIEARDIEQEAYATERLGDLRTVVAPRSVVVGPARVTRYRERGQRITIDVASPQPALLFVNQTYFSAWDARANGRGLETLPLDVDRLGVIVPAGTSRIELRFGRHHMAVAGAWIASSLLLMASLLIQIRDGRAGEVQRSGDEDASPG